MNEMLHFPTLQAYCQGIGISTPQWEDFDIRSFEENMKSVRHQMPPFKHEFYAIALKLDGEGIAATGNYQTPKAGATIFFNSPYQITHWDIAPDWKGYYVIFSEDFLFGRSRRLIEQFPFLLVDNTIPMSIDDAEARLFTSTFRDIHSEFHSDLADSREVIRHYLEILLVKTSRTFNRLVNKDRLTYNERNRDLNLVSRFESLIETSFHPGFEHKTTSPHQVQYYADQLAIHPNHLNAVVKRITSHSASEHIQKHVLHQAKSTLKHTGKSVKEIAHELHYPYPNHFTNFFKRQTGMTPLAFRRNASSH